MKLLTFLVVALAVEVAPMSTVDANDRRTPSNVFDWYSDGMIDERFLNPDLTVSQIRSLLSGQGSFSEGDDALLFKFLSGGNIKISHSGEKVTGLNFLYGNKPKEEKEVQAKFNEIVGRTGSKQTILRHNPYQELELKVRNTLAGNRQGESPQKQDLCSTFEIQSGLNAIPDQHGDPSRYEFVLDALQNKKVDWFGIEMVPHTMQPVVSDFINEKNDSSKFKEAKDRLIEYFSHHWNDKFGGGLAPPVTNGADNQYFKLLEAARSRGIQVYSMDTDLNYYITNPIIDPLVVGTRNLNWANQLPDSGKGLVLGGKAHFQTPPGAEVQSFYHLRAPNQPIRLLDAKGTCELAEGTKIACRADLEKFSLDEKCKGLTPVRCLRRVSPFVSRQCAGSLGLSQDVRKPSTAPAIR